MQNGINEGLFFPHDKTVAMQVAEIVVNSADENSIIVSEQDMYNRERRAFLNLAKHQRLLLVFPVYWILVKL